jgi:two-component sensor histidine kinase
MQDDAGVVTTERSRSDLDARLRKAVAAHAARRGVSPIQVVDAIEQFLEQAPRQRDVTLEEISHRVKNELQLLSSAMRQRRGMRDEDGQSRCDACIGQVAALAQLNAAVDDDPGATEVDLGQQALDFAAALRGAFGLDTGARGLDMQAEQIFVPRKVARNLLLIMNEAVTNAVKHGIGTEGGAVRIGLMTLSCDAAQLTVENETINACFSRAGGSGRSLIDALSAGIRGNVVREASGRSFLLTCRFPLPHSGSCRVVR